MDDEKERFTRSNCKSSDEPLSWSKNKVLMGFESSQEFSVQVGLHQDLSCHYCFLQLQ